MLHCVVLRLIAMIAAALIYVHEISCALSLWYNIYWYIGILASLSLKRVHQRKMTQLLLTNQVNQRRK